jgi:hypothetical protein
MADRAEYKVFSGFAIKDADKGEVEAIVATLDVIDHDGDIIRSDAIKDGSKVVMSGWGHDAVFGNPPAGKGALHIDGKKLKFDGRVFLKTTGGRESFEVLKELGPEAEWSFGFRVLGSEVPSEAERKQGAFRIITKAEAFEVSPVMMGAGIGTRTVGVKSAQADGADGEDAAAAKAVADAAVLAQEKLDAIALAETKAAEDAAARERAEADRIAAETKAAHDAAVAAQAKAVEDRAAELKRWEELQVQIALERQQFLRTLERNGVAP